MQQDPLSHICPLCGQSNSCQQVEQPERLKDACGSAACWCMSVHLNEQSRQTLKNQTDGKRCLCRTCIQKMAQAQQ